MGATKRTQIAVAMELLDVRRSLIEAQEEARILRHEIEEAGEARDAACGERDTLRDAAAPLSRRLRDLLGMVTIRSEEEIQELDRALALLEDAL